MPIQLDVETRLQPRKPDQYRLPTVVQPQWHWHDLIRHDRIDAADALRAHLCSRYGVKHCLLLDRARSGVFLLCKAFGLDGEWIMPSLMHRPTAVVLANHSAGIAFADSDDHMTLAPASAERMINSRTHAILATHTYGKAADIRSLRAVADKHGLILVENAVHLASGIAIGGRRLGAWGDATMLSFNVDKPLGGILGGALLTNRDDVWNAISKYALGPPNTEEMRERLMITYTAYRLKPVFLRLPGGRKHRAAADGVAEIESFDISAYQQFTPRRIHPMQAKVAMACLQRETKIIHARSEHAKALNEYLRTDQRFITPVSTDERPHTFTYYPVVLKDGSRYKLGERLADAGIESKWRLAPLHLQAGFTECRRDELQIGNHAWKQHLLLPMGPSTTRRHVEYLASALLKW